MEVGVSHRELLSGSQWDVGGPGSAETGAFPIRVCGRGKHAVQKRARGPREGEEAWGRAQRVWGSPKRSPAVKRGQVGESLAWRGRPPRRLKNVPTRCGVPSGHPPINATLTFLAYVPSVGPIRSDTLLKWARPPGARFPAMPRVLLSRDAARVRIPARLCVLLVRGSVLCVLRAPVGSSRRKAKSAYSRASSKNFAFASGLSQSPARW